MKPLQKEVAMTNDHDVIICQRCQTDAIIAHIFYLPSRYGFETTPELAWAIRQHVDELLRRENVDSLRVMLTLSDPPGRPWMLARSHAMPDNHSAIDEQRDRYSALVDIACPLLQPPQMQAVIVGVSNKV